MVSLKTEINPLNFLNIAAMDISTGRDLEI